jgi:dipeptidyl aminopeptidase/acylaminoacyl peptidase
MQIPALLSGIVGAFLLATLSFVAVPAAAAELELIPREAIFGNPTRTQGRISPDGKWISWLAPRNGMLNVWVAPIGDLSKGRPITDESVRPIRQHFWARDSKTVLYINDRGGDENYLLYGVDPATGARRSYTPFEKTTVQIYATSHSRSNELLIGLNNRNTQFHDVHLLNLTTGGLKLVYLNERFGGFVGDDKLAIRFALREMPGGGQELLKLERGDFVSFAVVPPEDTLNTSTIGMTRDGRNLLWLDSRGRDKSALVTQDVATGKVRVLGESNRADVSNSMLHPVTGVPEAYAVNYLKTEWTPIGNAVKSDIAALNKLISGQWEVLARNDADSIWVVSVDDVDKPITYHLYDRQSRKLSPLFVTRPELSGKPLAGMKGVEIKARDGLTMPSFLTLPVGSDADNDGRPDKPLPMVLNVHGGPWAQDVFGYDGEAQWLANRGYAVLQVNYRGSSGFGKAFIEAANREFAGKMHDDLIDALKWAVDNGIAAPDRVAIYGGSYGGYATLVGLTFTPTTFACGVDIVGPSSLATLIESFPDYWQPFLESTWYRRAGNPGKPDERAFLLSRSPISKLDQIQRPLLIAQGANDPRVTKKESDQIVAGMVAKQLPVTYVIYADEGHGFARPENRISFYAISEQFLQKCLGGRVEPLGSALKDANLTVPQGAAELPELSKALAARP